MFPLQQFYYKEQFQYLKRGSKLFLSFILSCFCFTGAVLSLQCAFFFFTLNWINNGWIPPLLSLFLTNLFMMKACFTWVLFFLFYAAITAWNYTTVKLETTEFIAFEFLQQSYHAFLAQLHSCSNIGSDISITRPFSPTHEHTVTERDEKEIVAFY